MPQEKRPTLKDLIKKTGFSHGAISRAFNGQPGISTATRDLILKTAREMGYYPNPSARNFKRGYSGRIGVILPNLRNSNYSELYEQFDRLLTSSGSSSILALTHDDVEVEANTILHWSAGETDALILNPVRAKENIDLYRKVKSWGYPLLFLYGNIGGDFDGVGVDYDNSIAKALKYLQNVGHREVAYVGQIPPSPTPQGKYSVLLRQLQACGMSFDEKHSVLDVNAEVAGALALDRWRRLGSMPSVVVAYNDHTATSIFYEAKYRGLSIPGDFSLLGSDDVSEAKLIGLSTIRTDRMALATEVVRMLDVRMKTPEEPPQYSTMHCELVLRDSLGPAPKRK